MERPSEQDGQANGPAARVHTVIRYTAMVYRNPQMSEEDFHKHWCAEHGPLVRDWLQHHGILKYTQVLAAPFLCLSPISLSPSLALLSSQP